ncbi:hypothetical protein KM043_016179 [Ampulex compressa]|nr:hypothetical protein KM043_016179 [Ampulex compressa]
MSRGKLKRPVDKWIHLSKEGSECTLRRKYIRAMLPYGHCRGQECRPINLPGAEICHVGKNREARIGGGLQEMENAVDGSTTRLVGLDVAA